MRISTSTIYSSGIASMQQQTERLLQTQQQISSGRRILSPADDPVAAARALEGLLEPAHYHGLAGRLGGISHVYHQELQRASSPGALAPMLVPGALREKIQRQSD